MSATAGTAVVFESQPLPKTMRWWDTALLLGLSEPAFYLVGICFSVVALGPIWAMVLWAGSAILGMLQAYVYTEPAAMFPDKAGLSLYAREGWRQHFSLTGPLAVFGYWLAWTTLLAVFGAVIGRLVTHEFLPDSAETWSWTLPGLGWDITTDRLIGLGCMVAAWGINLRGQRSALRFNWIAGAFVAIPLAVIAVGPFLTGDVTNHALGGNNMAGTLEFYGWPDGTWGRFVLVMAWLYIFGYNTYGAGCTATFAPEYKHTKDDTRKAILAVGGINVVCALLLPVAIVGTVGQDALASDTTGFVYLIDVWHAIVGDTAGKIIVALLCAGLLLMMNAGTMASSRVLHAMAKEGMTLRWFGRLNRNSVPGRAMTLGLVLNAWLIFQFPTVFFILAVGNLGFLLAHVLALSGFLLLRRDRPRWPRPIRLGPFWLVVAACACLVNLAFIVFGLIGLSMTGYAYDAPLTNPTAWMGRIVIVGVLALVLGCAGYIVGQHQQGKRFSLRDRSDQQPTVEAIDEVARGSPTRSTLSSTSIPPPA